MQYTIKCKYTAKDIEKVKKLYAEGMKVLDIVAMTGISQTSIRRWITPNRKISKEKASLKTIQQAINMYKDGRNTTEIGKIIGYNPGTIAGWLRKRKIAMRHKGPQSKIKREDYFDSIDSDEKAYYLGWIMADGNVSIYNNQYSLKIHIATEDEETILSFLRAIKSSNAVSRRTQIDRQGNECYSSYVSLTSKHMCEALIKLGVVPNKTGEESFPDIPQELYPAFLRGFFDGDGITCIKNNRRSGFISSHKMLVRIQSLLGLKKTIHHPPNTKNPNVDYFHLGRHDSKILYDFIYDSATVWMKRKRERLAIVCGNTEITA